MRKFIIISSLTVLVALFAFIYIKFYFVFGEGVKAGSLNYVVYKGVVFKTYEGKLIQTGLRSGTKTGGAIQSYEFEFSIEDNELAEKLMLLSGKNVELHYKEYFGVIPWRGYTKFIVDDLVLVDGEEADSRNTPQSVEGSNEDKGENRATL